MIGLLGVFALVVLALSSYSKRTNQRRQEEQERMLADELVPGAWVHTRVGFYGRFVDIDGDVVILETPSGEETYWNKAVVRGVGDLPFAIEEHVEAWQDGEEVVFEAEDNQTGDTELPFSEDETGDKE